MIYEEAFDGCTKLTVTAVRDSYAAQYCESNGINVTLTEGDPETEYYSDTAEETESVSGTDYPESLNQFEATEKLHDGDFLYTVLDNGTAMITNYVGQSEHAEVPAELGGVSVTAIGCDAFAEHAEITSVTITEGVEIICDRVFQYCENLQQITLPASITYIGGAVWFECFSLQSFEVADGNTAYRAVDGVLFTADGQELVQYPLGSETTAYDIPEGTVSVFYYALECAEHLTSIGIPASLQQLNVNFYDCISLTDFVVDEGNTSFETANGVLYNRDGTLLTCPQARTDTVCTVQPGTKAIADDAFSNCASLTAVILPDGLETIGTYAFNSCTSLTDIVLPDSITVLDQGCFARCSSLTAVTVPAGVRSLPFRAFYECSSLTDITLQDGLLSIDANAFQSCGQLARLVLPDSVTSIDINAFKDSPTVPVVTRGSSAEAACTSAGFTSIEYAD